MNRRYRSGGNPSDHIHHALVYVSGICFMVLSFKMQFFGGDISSLQYFSGWTWYLDHDWRNVKTQESKKKNKSSLSIPYFIICLNVFSKTKNKYKKWA